jgi:hypothetical protein
MLFRGLDSRISDQVFGDRVIQASAVDVIDFGPASRLLLHRKPEIVPTRVTASCRADGHCYRVAARGRPTSPPGGESGLFARVIVEVTANAAAFRFREKLERSRRPCRVPSRDRLRTAPERIDGALRSCEWSCKVWFNAFSSSLLVWLLARGNRGDRVEPLVHNDEKARKRAPVAASDSGFSLFGPLKIPSGHPHARHQRPSNRGHHRPPQP